MSAQTSVVPGQEVSWEQYEQLGEDTRAEYVDGRVLMSPSPTRQHQKACYRLAAALEAVLPDDLDVALAWSWKPRSDEFVPDVMVHPRTPETTRFTGLPVLVVEVLSGRSDDLVLKATKYAALGLERYWVLDPRDRVLDAYVNAGDGYRRDARVSEDAPAEVSFGPASLRVDLRALLAD